MKPGLFLGGLLLGALAFYHHGFTQGDLDRRLKDADMMGQQVEQEMLRHYQAENYWQDKAENCLAHGQEG